MSAVIRTEDAQAWLQNTKYDVTTIESSILDASCGEVFGMVGQRYDTSGWTTRATTPALVVSLISMRYAGVYLRIVASEEDGLTRYADWLDKYIEMTIEKIMNGTILLDGETSGTNSALGLGPAFFPDNTATVAFEEDHQIDGSTTNESAAAIAFSMNDTF